MEVRGTSDHRSIELFELDNGKGLEATVMNYGGIIQSLRFPDRYGVPGDIVLGFDSPDDYVQKNPYFGCIVGRYGNRIGGGRFSLEGREYVLARNNGENNLHGGISGFDKVLWNAGKVAGGDNPAIEFSYRSPDGEEGFPGNLDINVRYTLTEDNSLRIDYSAVTDAITIVNLTNHTYWNLAGEGTGDVLDHILMINADAFTPVDAGLIPTGIETVEGTPFDFRMPLSIGARISDRHQQLRFGNGYDHNWVLNKDHPGALDLAATAYEKSSGRYLEVFTTEPGVQFYTGNFLEPGLIGKGGRHYGPRTGFCLETQHYPDSPNKPDFPPVVIRPGETYRTSTIYKFSVRNNG